MSYGGKYSTRIPNVNQYRARNALDCPQGTYFEPARPGNFLGTEYTGLCIPERPPKSQNDCSPGTYFNREREIRYHDDYLYFDAECLPEGESNFDSIWKTEYRAEDIEPEEEESCPPGTYYKVARTENVGGRLKHYPPKCALGVPPVNNQLRGRAMNNGQGYQTRTKGQSGSRYNSNQQMYQPRY